MAGIYIHIPFCQSRCIYCGFYSTTLLNLRGQYIDAVCKEMALRKNYIDNEAYSTIYIGGGTPSLLTQDELQKLFSNLYKTFNISSDTEITLECNPNDITTQFAKMLTQLPVNRISIGAQTFSDSRLKLIHRRHNTQEVYNAINLLRSIGISNISIDLMFGFPGETLEEWTSDIDKALELDVEHISAYSLMYEDGTQLTDMLEQGKIKEIDDETSLAMYKVLVSRLTSNGYEHYEISNFARKGYRSRHNSSYWQQTKYIGLGAAAHSFDIKSRQWNISDIRKYILGIGKGIIPMEREILDADTTYNDIITTALRTKEGINLNKITTQLGNTYRKYLINNAKKHILGNTLELSGNNLRLTYKGIYLSDMIMSDLMIV